MFQSLLIANRGEIACRIIRTARRMGLRSIAVFSDADETAQHVQMADEAIHIGPAPARESYLNIPAIIAAAKRAGADAIHPGYGFLSENPAFAEACAEAGIIFVGPTASAMRAMGSKGSAKALMEKAGVPLLPGYHGAEQDAAFLEGEAKRIGFPLVIKAVAGGGGRGMRVVRAAADFAAALQSARQEGASAFGDDRVLIERYLERPRHIEVQVFGDSHGNAVHLFERDCSAQRRHQKVIEEAPAPGISAEMRHAMGAAAVAAAKAVQYQGAGTVEFIAQDGGFYFLEMNTRLQVEHPVTEAITGFDLVEWQLRVAAGEKLPVQQSDIHAQGHAMELRLYAEDPARDFAPSIGALQVFRLSEQGLRIDSGFVAGDRISIHYDAMVAKMIAHAPTRAEAIARLRAGLAQSDIIGVAHNLDMLDRILAHPDFASGTIDTGFIGRNAETLLTPKLKPSPKVLTLAALGVLAVEEEAARTHASASADPYSPWHATDHWWVNTRPTRVFEFHHEDETYAVTLAPAADGWRISAGGAAITARHAKLEAGSVHALLDGMRLSASIHRAGETINLRHAAQSWRLVLPDPIARAGEEEGGDDRLIAPLPGQVTQLLATENQNVARGDVLVILEAMKTVFRLTAPRDGRIETISCRVGETVREGQILLQFAAEEDEAT
ncbi:MAG: 3-methylcrotonyl-CoA carboxylase subunit alpha [Pseudomonadota bacterium]|jgi:3-methylcrotonyl-CoA carboxylase alpha subunit